MLALRKSCPGASWLNWVSEITLCELGDLKVFRVMSYVKSSLLEEIMVVIRLARNGKKKLPQYKIMVADKQKSATGRFIEKIGNYNPQDESSSAIILDSDRYNYWVGVGAQPSDTVKSLFKKFAKTQASGNAAS